MTDEVPNIHKLSTDAITRWYHTTYAISRPASRRVIHGFQQIMGPHHESQRDS
jgi:hypothetical protein